MDGRRRGRSIDQVSLAERHGRVSDQFTLWFGLNANIFVVFHAIEGPKLDVPQMIQSRGQLGFYGAVLAFAASIFLDVGFLAAQLVIQADAMNLLFSDVSIPEWIAILVVPVAALTVFGYDWIHRSRRS